MVLGLLRASHRKLDPARSESWRPWHSHDDVQKLVPGALYPLDVEIWPTSMVLAKGWRWVLTAQGHDFVATLPGRMRHDHSSRPARHDMHGGRGRCGSQAARMRSRMASTVCWLTSGASPAHATKVSGRIRIRGAS